MEVKAKDNNRVRARLGQEMKQEDRCTQGEHENLTEKPDVFISTCHVYFFVDSSQLSITLVVHSYSKNVYL